MPDDLPEVLAVDLPKLREAVRTAADCLSPQTHDYFKLRGVAQTAYIEEDELMAPLIQGATPARFAVELVDAEEDESQAVRVRNASPSAADLDKWAGELWKRWVESDW